MNPKTLPRAGDKPVKYCIRYLRVSTSRQTHTDADVVEDGNSIDTQRKACAANEKRLGLVCVAEYIEPGASAQSIAKRKEFKKVLKHFKEQSDATYLSIYMRSRAFRDYVEAGLTERELNAIGVKLVSAKEDYGDDLNGEFMKALTDVVNWYEVRRNGADIKEKMANKVMNGGTPSKAKLGYLNVTINSEGRKINTIVVDEERKPLIIAAFELMATGTYTLDTLHEQVTAMGLRSRPTKHRPNGSVITHETLRLTLRDRYYVGWITFKGVEYKGRHETFISEELFDRVQRVLDSHQGAGVRERTHPHYLKGWLWCDRCGKRFILQRAKGNGGEYYYFFCIGRQDGTCDHPYVPVEKLERAVERFYAGRVRLPEAFRTELRAMVDAAVDEEFSLSDELRDQYTRRLEALDKKESYFLDLAAEEDWPKEKLREKIRSVRTERDGIERNLANAHAQLDVGRGIFYKALALFDAPADAYAVGDETVRTLLNKTFVARFMIDGRKVVKAELKEPFDALLGAAERDEVRVYLRSSGSLPHRSSGTRGGRGRATLRQLATCPSLLTETGAHNDLSLTDLLELAILERAKGSSKTVMVGDTGIEPVTSTVSR